MSGEFKRCIDCVSHRPLEVLDSVIHLCALPAYCAPPTEHDDADHWRDIEDRQSDYQGTSCDVMRRMGAMCGPRATLWSSQA